MSVTNCNSHYPRCRTKNCVHSGSISFSGLRREDVALFLAYECSQSVKTGQWRTNVIMLRLAVGYLSAALTRRTWWPELVIGTDGSSQMRQNLWVDRYGLVFGLPRRSRLGFCPGMEPILPIFVVQTRSAARLPGPVVNPSPRSLDTTTSETPSAANVGLPTSDYAGLGNSIYGARSHSVFTPSVSSAPTDASCGRTSSYI